MSFAWKGFHSFGGGFSPSFGPSLTGGITPIGLWDASTSTLAQLAALVSHSRTSLATMFDSTGKLTYAPNNLLLNTATLGTQTVTVQVGANYILSIKGTGSVTLTGASTAGPLNGTGAANRVDLKITAATSSLTLTVAGSVTSARLSAVTYEAAFRSQDDVDNTASAYYGPRIDYDPNTLAVKGLLIEEPRTNLQTQSNFSDWAVQTGATITANSVVSIDGTTNGATVSLPAFAQILTPAMTVNGSAYTQSVWVKGAVGGEMFQLTAFNTTDGVLASSTQTATTSWARYSWTVTPTNGTTTYFYIYNATASAKTIYVAYGQIELGGWATSNIATAGASVSRAGDVFSFIGSASTTLKSSAFTAIVESQLQQNVGYVARIIGAHPGGPLFVNSATSVGAYNGAVTLTGTVGASGNYTTGAVRSAIATDALGRSVVANGGTVATDANLGFASTPTTVYLGVNNGVTSFFNGWIKSFAIYNQRLPDATLQARSVVGASY